MRPADLCDLELVQSVIVGDDAAADEFVNRFTNLVWWMLMHQMRVDRESATEIYQDVWIHLWRDNYRRLRNWDGPGDFAPYLRVVVLNYARDWLRRKRDFVALPPSFEKVENPDPGALQVAWIEQQRELVEQALVSLSPDNRELYELAFVQGLGRQEIAATLGIKPNNVGVRLHRLVERLQREILPVIENPDVRSDGPEPSSKEE